MFQIGFCSTAALQLTTPQFYKRYEVIYPQNYIRYFTVKEVQATCKLRCTNSKLKFTTLLIFTRFLQGNITFLNGRHFRKLHNSSSYHRWDHTDQQRLIAPIRAPLCLVYSTDYSDTSVLISDKAS